VVSAVALGVLLAWLLGAFGAEANPLRPRISAQEARELAQGGAPPAPPRGRPVTVTVGANAIGHAVPADFLGLSFEATAVPLLARYSQAGNLVALMRSLGHGVIRVGGVSVDQRVAWSQAGRTRPAWATSVITPHDLEGLAQLARESGWNVLLTVNLAHYESAAAAQEAAAARSLLGGMLAGIAIGNEPDRYAREGLRAPGWGYADYERQLDAYRSAIERAAPGVAIVSPDASSGLPPLSWVASTAATRPALLTDHYYPLTSCGGTTPVLSELMSPILRQHEAEVLARLLQIEAANQLPVRVDETGSISCHGEPGVSNAFASALWAADWIARTMHDGIAGLNFHDLFTERGAYSPLVFASQTTARAGAAAALHANPDWYGLLMTAPLTGSVPVASTVTGGVNLTAQAFLGGAAAGQPHELRLVLVDFEEPSSSPLLVHVRVPAQFTGGSVLRLMAPSSASQSAVQLGAKEVAPGGNWNPRTPLPRVYGGAGALALEMPASSAALVTLTADASH
jgi:hypothetical protein